MPTRRAMEKVELRVSRGDGVAQSTSRDASVSRRRLSSTIPQTARLDASGLSMPLRLSACLVLVLLGTAPAAAQFATPTLPTLQLGLGLTPGTGLQAGYVSPAFTILTREAVLYADYEPRFLDEDAGRLLVGLGVGGSVRVLRALTVIADFDAGGYDLDAGFRFGPSFFFSFFEETAASKARSFRLFAEPFVRGSLRFSRRVIYVEVGTQPSHVRGGLLFVLR